MLSHNSEKKMENGIVKRRRHAVRSTQVEKSHEIDEWSKEHTKRNCCLESKLYFPAGPGPMKVVVKMAKYIIEKP